jgi:hypothetical protein
VGFCDGQKWRWGRFFSRELRFPLPIYIPSVSPQSSSLSPEAGTIGQECRSAHRLTTQLLRRIVAGFPPRRPAFKAGSGHVGFCDGQKWRWGRFSPRTSVSPANLHSICFSTIIFTITRGWHNRPGVAAVPIVSQTKYINNINKNVCIRGGPQKPALAPRPLKIYCASPFFINPLLILHLE